MRFAHDGRRYRSAIIFGCVFFKCVEMRWNYCAFQRNSQEYVFGTLWSDFQPIGIIKRSAVDANSTSETVKSQKQLRPAVVAEAYVDFFSTTLGYMCVSLRLAPNYREVCTLEYWFN